MRVIIDRVEGDYYIGRTEFDSPEVDPEVLIDRLDGCLLYTSPSTIPSTQRTVFFSVLISGYFYLANKNIK